MQGSCAWIYGRIDCKPSYIQRSFFATNPKNALLRANPSKFPYMCIVWSPKKNNGSLHHPWHSSVLLFVSKSRLFGKLGAPQDQSHLSRFYKNCRRVDPSTNQKGNHWSLFWIRGPNFEVYQDDGFLWWLFVWFILTVWVEVIGNWHCRVIHATRMFTCSKFTIQN